MTTKDRSRFKVLRFFLHQINNKNNDIVIFYANLKTSKGSMLDEILAIRSAKPFGFPWGIRSAIHKLMKYVVYTLLLSLLCGCSESQDGSDNQTGTEQDDYIEQPLETILVENGLPVLIEYAKLLQQFEKGSDGSPTSLVDLAFGAVNTVQNIAIDSVPVEDGWQEKAGKRFHKYLSKEVKVISNDKRLDKARKVLERLTEANKLNDDFSLHLIKEKEKNANCPCNIF